MICCSRRQRVGKEACTQGITLGDLESNLMASTPKRRSNKEKRHLPQNNLHRIS
jgi:hypothetical protein